MLSRIWLKHSSTATSQSCVCPHMPLKSPQKASPRFSRRRLLCQMQAASRHASLPPWKMSWATASSAPTPWPDRNNMGFLLPATISIPGRYVSLRPHHSQERAPMIWQPRFGGLLAAVYGKCLHKTMTPHLPVSATSLTPQRLPSFAHQFRIIHRWPHYQAGDSETPRASHQAQPPCGARFSSITATPSSVGSTTCKTNYRS
jgi:hypothetical protein